MNSARSAIALLVGVGVAASGAVNAGMIDKSGMEPWEICGLCHGLDGNSPMPKFPKLSAQKAAYIEAQFWAFRHQKRSNDGGQMQAITEEVSADDVAQIAAYFARQAPPDPEPAEAGESNLYALGKRLFHQGDDAIPACVSCHNADHPTAPWLDAQHPDYLHKQLQDFASAQRNNGDADIMKPIAKRLSEREKDALVDYLSQTQLRPRQTPPDQQKKPETIR